MAYVVRCREPRRNVPAQVCDGFVARVPFSYTLRAVEHTDDADRAAHVSRCGKCGTLYEIREVCSTGCHDVA